MRSILSLVLNVCSVCGFQGTGTGLPACSGDGEIRTLDPLLARQVLSQLSYTPSSPSAPLLFDPDKSGSHPALQTSTISSSAPGCLTFFKLRHPPALPYRYQHSTIGRTGLNRRVRDGNGCAPCAYRHRRNSPLQSKTRQHTHPLLYSLERR